MTALFAVILAAVAAVSIWFAWDLRLRDLRFRQAMRGVDAQRDAADLLPGEYSAADTHDLIRRLTSD